MTTVFDPAGSGRRRGGGYEPPEPDVAVDESAMESAPAPATDPHGVRTSRHLPHHDLPVLESYRGIAALMVVVTHVGFAAGTAVAGPWAGWISRLDFGVALFFLLSGFLLFRPYVQAAYGHRPPVRLGTYLRRRYVRLYPALILVLVANYFITPEARDPEITDTALWVQTTLMVQNYFVPFTQQMPGLFQLWSLSTEVSFYLALPLMAWLVLGGGTSLGAATERLRAARADTPGTGVARVGDRTAARRRRRRLMPADLRPWRPAIVLAVLAVIAVVWRIYWTLDTDDYGTKLLWLPAYFDWFAAGMVMAWLRERPLPVPVWLRTLAASPGVCLSMALAAFWLVTTNIGGPAGLDPATALEGTVKHFAYLVAASLLLVPAVFGEPGAQWRTWATAPVMRWLGQISFGVFLWHPMLMEAIRRALGQETFSGGFWITLVLTLITSMVAASLSWRYLEKPAQERFRDGFRRRSSRRPTATAEPVRLLPRIRYRLRRSS